MYRLLLKGQLTRLRSVGLLLLGLIGIVLAVLARYANDSPEFIKEEEQLNAAASFVAEYGLSIVVPVCTLWIATSLVGNLVEDRLLAYLWLKPVSRWALPVAALAATTTIMVPLAVVPIVVAATISGNTALITSALFAAVLGVIAYGGPFIAFGVRSTRALWWGLVYILVWENTLARLSDGTGRMSIRSYLTSIVQRATDVDLALADRGPVSSIVVPLLVAALGVALAQRLLSTSDID